jgi:hypothetical protein
MGTIGGVVVVVVVVVIVESSRQSVGVPGKTGSVLPHIASKGPGVKPSFFEQASGLSNDFEQWSIPRRISSFG